MPFCSMNPLLSLIKDKDNKAAKSIIRKGNLYNANVNRSRRDTLLHYAAQYGNSEIVQFLIDSGSQVDAQNNLKQTPLIKSLNSDSPCKEVIEILLKAGANIEKKDIGGKSALRILNNIEWLTTDTRRFKILRLFIEQNVDMIDLDVLMRGNKQVIKSLLQTNIDISKPFLYERTLVHILAKNSNPGVIEQLHGRYFNANVHDDFGQTPLMYAVTAANIKAVEFLLSEGADLEATDNIQRTALFLAIDEGFLFTKNYINGTVQFLLEHGADAQTESDCDELKTIFDLLSGNEYYTFELPDLVIAHLAMQEALGTAITDLVCDKLNETPRYEAYFEYCQQQLPIEIYPSVTVLDVLTASEKQWDRYFRNEKLASTLTNFKTKIDYFDNILTKRLSKAARMIRLRKVATQIVCKLIKMKYNSYPLILNEIVDYLEEHDIQNLVLIENYSK